MPLLSISLESLINTPPIAPGVGGWDANLTTQLNDVRGRYGHGLLGRTLITNPPNSGPGDAVLTCPTGYRALCTHMILLWQENFSSGNQWKFYCDEGTNPAVQQWNDNVVIDPLIGTSDPDQGILVYPNPLPADGDPFTNGGAVPILNPDNSHPSMRLIRASGDASINVLAFFYGHWWPATD